jgi:cytochrome bd-type quinol oxidase subunit 2
MNREIAYGIIIVIGVLSLIGTIFAAVQTEENYSKSTRNNILRLSSFYVIFLLILFIGVIWYMLK